MTSNTLLIVDGDSEVYNHIESAANECGFDTSIIKDGDQFRSYLRAQQPSALILDLNLPGEDGIELLNFLNERNLTTPTVLMGKLDTKVLGTAERIAKARGLSVVGTLRKPVANAALEELFNVLGRQCHAFTLNEFREALVQEQLTLDYQPIFDITGNTAPKIVSCEALVRWNHPRHGLLLPGEFISIIETSDLIADLTLFVLEEALRQVSCWRQSGYNVPVSVNVPVSFLLDEISPVWLTMILHKHNVSASDLVLEVTERDIISDVNQFMETAIRLRLLNVRLSIDDFGIGHSSLRQLQQMPFSDVKIDRSFVSELPSQGDARDIVRSTINLAHRLGLSVCAEGVESNEILNILRDMGCEKAQGFLFCRPISADKLLPLFTQRVWQNLSTTSNGVIPGQCLSITASNRL